MQFNIFLRNHHTSSVASLEDMIRVIAAGLEEAGHLVQYEYTQLLPRPWVNLMFEYFADEALMASITGQKRVLGDDLVLGLVATEDPEDTISMGEAGDQKRLDAMTRHIPLFDFIWCIPATAPYERMVDGRVPVGLLPMGYCPSLARPSAAIQSNDVLMYGKLNRWRAPVVHSLLERGAQVQGTFGDMPEFMRTNLIQRSKMILDMRRGKVVRYLSQTRVVAALHYGSLAVSELFDTTESGRFYRYTVAAEYDRMADRVMELLADDSARQAEADRLRALFAAELPMKKIMEGLVAAIPR
jgi:hypothetical protein